MERIATPVAAAICVFRLTHQQISISCVETHLEKVFTSLFETGRELRQ
jgi:hypothetical protein